MAEPVAVLVVSRDPLARGGLAALVAAQPELRLAGDASPETAAARAQAAAPAAVLWDVGPGAGAGAAGLGVVAERAPVVALVAAEGQAAAAVRAGARGVLARDAAPDAVAAALAAAALGLTVLDAPAAGGLVRAPEAAAPAEPLTNREREVLALLAEGLANKAIAARLGISDHTAKFHVNAILAKLGVESRAEAIVRAARMGLVVL
ncbi:MAG TPA: LuxR C-terminal-related transcriptional regulator [Anaeromyxobacter sp.]|nr:LuxR C-terminal-related transcriptional regulator [Anaeromyxobacter sp.]